jgi:hypothetical protein
VAISGRQKDNIFSLLLLSTLVPISVSISVCRNGVPPVLTSFHILCPTICNTAPPPLAWTITRGSHCLLGILQSNKNSKAKQFSLK